MKLNHSELFFRDDNMLLKPMDSPIRLQQQPSLDPFTPETELGSTPSRGILIDALFSLSPFFSSGLASTPTRKNPVSLGHCLVCSMRDEFEFDSINF